MDEINDYNANNDLLLIEILNEEKKQTKYIRKIKSFIGFVGFVYCSGILVRILVAYLLISGMLNIYDFLG